MPATDWYGYSVETRNRAREEGRVVAVAPGWCHRCHTATSRPAARLSHPAGVDLSCTAAHDPSRVDAADPSPAAERLEDLTWMAATGETLAGAAMRLGITEGAVEQFLRRQSATDTLQQLRTRRLDGEAAA